MNTFNPDSAIKSSKEDILNRKEFSEKIASAITNWNFEESLVVSINSVWGYGKTSVLNMIKESIIKQDTNSDKDTIVINFDPWLYSNINNLHEMFFRDIINGIGRKDSSEEAKKLAEKWQKYLDVLEYIPTGKDINKIISLIVILYVIFSGITSIVPIYIKYFFFILYGIFFFFYEPLLNIVRKRYQIVDRLFEKGKKSVIESKAEIIESMKESKKKIIIIIDDIDRLIPSEICDLLKLVKNNANFPNTVYLLAFDKDIVAKNIFEYLKVDGKDYLEKIIQVKLDLPLLLEEELNIYLIDELKIIFEELHFPFTENSIKGLEEIELIKVFGNLRDIKVFINSLKFNFSLLANEVSTEINPLDFLVLEAIRLFFPNYFNFIKVNKLIFLEPDKMSFLFNDKQKQEKNEKIKLLISEAIKNYNRHYSTIIKLTTYLFPELYKIFNDGVSFYQEKDDYLRKMRVCSIHYFDAYFTFIPGGSVNKLTEKEFQKFLASLNDCKSIEELFLLYDNRKTLGKLIDKLYTVATNESVIEDKYVNNFILAVYNVGDKLISKTVNAFFSEIGYETDLTNLALKIFDRNTYISFEKLSDILQNTSGTIVPIQFISFIKSQKGRRKIDPESLQKLQKIGVGIIESLIENDTLFQKQNFIYILFCLQEWTDTDYFKNKMKEICNDEGKFLKIIFGLLGNHFGITNQIALSRHFLNDKESLLELFDLDDLINRINLILEYPNIDEIGRIKLNSIKDALQSNP